MTEKFSRSQIQTIVRYITSIMQKVVKPLYLESKAQAKVLDQMRQIGPDIAKKVDFELTNARSDPQSKQELDQECRVALEKALQVVFVNSKDAEVLKEVKNGLGLPN